MKTVLLTDDNEDMIELVQLILRQSGYELITASDGEEAVEKCMAKNPDLVLMDLNMPKKDGFAATKTLRDNGFQNPILVLTASDSDADRAKAEAAGCNEYILKTLNMDGLESTIDRYIADIGGV